MMCSVHYSAPASAERSVAGKSQTLEYTNPVWEGYLADPHVLKTKDGYYAYGTGGEHEGRQFPVLHSKDFADWKFVGNALESVTEPKLKAYWAPEVAERDGKFYLYYAGDYKMRVAVAARPAGPFKDAGKVLFPDEPFSIDGHPYRDPQSGKWYLFFAKDFLDERVGTALAVAELGDDMVSVTGPIRTVLRAVGDWQIYERNRKMYDRVFDAWHTVEGPAVIFRDNKYYCFYSGGNWQTPGYGVGFATSDTVMGPYRDTADLDGPVVLESIPGKLIGPGHNSVILGPDEATWFIVYHAWNADRTKRQMCIDPIEWTPQGPKAHQPSRGTKKVVLPLEGPAAALRGVTAPGGRVEKLSGEFEFTEGATCDPDGNVVFTDQPNDRIMKWGVDGKLSVFMQPANRSNGMMFDTKGNLYSCADEKNELWLIAPDKKVTVLVKDYNGKLLNAPNDVWLRPGGGLYFTDPWYKRDWWKRGGQEQEVEGVYYLPSEAIAAAVAGKADSATAGKLVRVIDDLKTPNGITGTPDGKTLYVSDLGAHRTYAYDIQPDGSLSKKRLFCELGSDGMTIDSEGNVYLTGDGVIVFDKTGRRIDHIKVPERWSANVCFGGKDRRTLFITASKGLYAVKMRIKGINEDGGK